MQMNKGFTLIELMVVVMIITIFAVIAVPTYKNYIRRAELSQAQQEMQKIADQLERYKGRSFSYNGFSLAAVFDLENDDPLINEADGVVYLPIGSNFTNAKYTLTLRDPENKKSLATGVKASAGDAGLGDSLGHSWEMNALSTDLANYSLVMNSQGVQCKTIDQTQVKLYRCDTTGTGEAW